jgi:hypothetical protein
MIVLKKTGNASQPNLHRDQGSLTQSTYHGLGSQGTHYKKGSMTQVKTQVLLPYPGMAKNHPLSSLLTQISSRRSYPQLIFLRFGFFHLGDDTKDLDLEGCRIEAVAGVSVLGAIGDGDDTIHFTF